MGSDLTFRASLAFAVDALDLYICRARTFWREIAFCTGVDDVPRKALT
jgi:hypothetical protein